MHDTVMVAGYPDMPYHNGGAPAPGNNMMGMAAPQQGMMMHYGPTPHGVMMGNAHPVMSHALNTTSNAESMAPVMAMGSHMGFLLGESKRIRKEKKLRKEKVPTTTTAPKRGEYRCGKCGFFPKKQKHVCSTEKQRRPSNSTASPASPPLVTPSSLSAPPSAAPEDLHTTTLSPSDGDTPLHMHPSLSSCGSKPLSHPLQPYSNDSAIATALPRVYYQ